MTTTPASARSEKFADTPVQKAALIVGIVFLLVGILGFIPGITTNLDQVEFASHHSEAMLMGVFQVSILHNIVHLLFGVGGIALARSFAGSRNYLIWGGAVYLVLWLYGLLVPHDSAANIVPLNNADNWLHLILGIGMVALGFLLGRRPRPTAANPTPSAAG